MKVYRVVFTYPTSMNSWGKEVNLFDDLDVALKFIEKSNHNSCTSIEIYESKNGKLEKVDVVVRDCYGGISICLRSVPEHVYRTLCSSEKWMKIIDYCQALDDTVHSKWLHTEEIDEYQNMCCKISRDLSYPCSISSIGVLVVLLEKLEQYAKNILDRLPKRIPEGIEE